MLQGNLGRVWGAALFLVEAIAVRGKRIAVISRTLDEPFILTALSLEGDEPAILSTVELADVGLRLDRPDALIGRGPSLHAIEQGRWHTLQLAG